MEIRWIISKLIYCFIKKEFHICYLKVGPLTNLDQTQCYSTHLTTFAGGLQILPKSINWEHIFANADFMKNQTIYLTIIFVSLIYIILIIYSRFKDKKDFEKLGVTPLPDNQKEDQYYYQIIVFTGQRKDAGTESKVHFVLSGGDSETRIRTFDDPKRKIFQRGGIDAFVMAVPK
jgi:polycystin 1L2